MWDGGQTRGVGVVMDLGTGQPVALVEWEERDAGQVIQWLSPLVEAYRVEVLVMDDLGSDRKVAEALGVRHPVCPWPHWRWVLRELQERKKEVHRARWPFIEKAAGAESDARWGSTSVRALETNGDPVERGGAFEASLGSPQRQVAGMVSGRDRCPHGKPSDRAEHRTSEIPGPDGPRSEDLGGGGGGLLADPRHRRPGLKVPSSPLQGRGSPLPTKIWNSHLEPLC